MPSIFIWKASSPISSPMITYYSGSNWVLEDHGTSSYSYTYDNQIMLSDGTIVYEVSYMPTNWIGTELLETITIPYRLIREDSNGILEQLGEWMRYRTKKEIGFERSPLEIEFSHLISTKMQVSHALIKDEPCMIRFSNKL